MLKVGTAVGVEVIESKRTDVGVHVLHDKNLKQSSPEVLTFESKPSSSPSVDRNARAPRCVPLCAFLSKGEHIDHCQRTTNIVLKGPLLHGVVPKRSPCSMV